MRSKAVKIQSRRVIIVCMLLMLAAFRSSAQQDALFSQYMFNMMLVNPAYTGSREVISLTSIYRHQWINLAGAPRTVTFSADVPLKNEKMGAGLVLYNDRLGIVNNTGFYANYSYRVRLSNNSTLAMGASGGVTNYIANFSGVKVDNSGGVDVAFSSDVSKIMPNLGVGLYYNTDKFYAGLSVPHVFNHKLDYDEGVTARQYRHVFLMAGFVCPLNHHFNLKPSTMIKYVNGAPIQADLNMNLWMYDKYSVGVSYRSLDAFLIMIEFQALHQLRVGYAFDYAHTMIREYNKGTHEIMLRYEFGYDKGKMLSPRYF